MDARRGQQVPHVVQLVTIGHLKTPLPVVSDIGRDVTVLVLGLGDHGNPLIHQPIQLGILSHRVDMGHRFNPLVAIAVGPVDAARILLAKAGRELDPVQLGRTLWIEQRAVKRGQHGLTAQFEAVGPETIRPFDSRHRDAAQNHMRTPGSIGERRLAGDRDVHRCKKCEEHGHVSHCLIPPCSIHNDLHSESPSLSGPWLHKDLYQHRNPLQSQVLLERNGRVHFLTSWASPAVAWLMPAQVALLFSASSASSRGEFHADNFGESPQARHRSSAR